MNLSIPRRSPPIMVSIHVYIRKLISAKHVFASNSSMMMSNSIEVKLRFSTPVMLYTIPRLSAASGLFFNNTYDMHRFVNGSIALPSIFCSFTRNSRYRCLDSRAYCFSVRPIAAPFPLHQLFGYHLLLYLK